MALLEKDHVDLKVVNQAELNQQLRLLTEEKKSFYLAIKDDPSRAKELLPWVHSASDCLDLPLLFTAVMTGAWWVRMPLKSFLINLNNLYPFHSEARDGTALEFGHLKRSTVIFFHSVVRLVVIMSYFTYGPKTYIPTMSNGVDSVSRSCSKSLICCCSRNALKF